MLVYLNGRFIPHAEAMVSVDDRGFLFADGIYEVARVYHGRMFEMDAHLERLRNGLRALQIGFGDVDNLTTVAEKLLRENQVTGDGIVYIQVTRGAAPRAHAFPAADTQPTVYVAARQFKLYPETHFSQGVDAITVPDNRWTRCDIKSVSLLPNVLANQAAHAAGAFEALFVRDGVVIEGSHSNLFAVIDGVVTTYPASNYVLPGITRTLVLDIAQELGIPAREAPIYPDDVFRSELFLSGTTTEIMPVVRVDGKPVRDGKPGPVTQRLREAYLARVRGFAESQAA